MGQILHPRESRQNTLGDDFSSPAVFVHKPLPFCNSVSGNRTKVNFSDKNNSDDFFNEAGNDFLNSLNQDENPCVLYIEDNPSNLRLVQSIFEKIPGIRLLSAPSAETGLKLVKENNVDLILLDINLPGMDGYEALQQLQNDSETRDITVMAVSAAAAPHDIEKGLMAGFKRYITKPINIDLFIEALNLELDIDDN